jgi:hypothetical protein
LFRLAPSVPQEEQTVTVAAEPQRRVPVRRERSKRLGRANEFRRFASRRQGAQQAGDFANIRYAGAGAIDVHQYVVTGCADSPRLGGPDHLRRLDPIFDRYAPA